MKCKHCKVFIARCEIPGETCYYHLTHGFHRCDGLPEAQATEPGTIAEPAAAAA